MRYVHQEYPKMVLGQRVNSEAEEARVRSQYGKQEREPFVPVCEPVEVTEPPILNKDGTPRKKPGRKPKHDHGE
jgi:hypothetical protein